MSPLVFRGATALAVAVLVGALGYRFGIPEYREYQVKKQVGEAVATLMDCQKQVAETQIGMLTGAKSAATIVCDGGVARGAPISQHVKSIAVSPSYAITLTLDFRTLPVLSPFTDKVTSVPVMAAVTTPGVEGAKLAIASWRCGSLSDGTTVPPQYLPRECKPE